MNEPAEDLDFWVGNLIYGSYLVAESTIALAGIAFDVTVRRALGWSR